jgi:hypothetical protein
LRLGLATQGALGIRCYDWVLIERGVCAIACRAALDPSVPDGSAMLPEWMHAQLRAAAHDDAHDDGAPTAHDSAAAAHDSASAGPVGKPLVGRLSAVVSAERLGLLRDGTAVGLAPSRALTVALRVTLGLARRGARDGAIQAEGEDDDAVGLALAAASSSEASAVSSADDDELDRELEEGPPRRRVDGRPTEGPPHAPSRAASAPRASFDAAALGAARRQLLGLPLLLGPVRATPIAQREALGALTGLFFYLVEQLSGHGAVIYRLNPVITTVGPDLLLLAAALFLVSRAEQHQTLMLAWRRLRLAGTRTRTYTPDGGRH